MFIMRAEVGIQEVATLVPTIRDGDVTNALNRLLRWLETNADLPHIPAGEVKDGTLTIDADKVNPSDLIAAQIVNNWYLAMYGWCKVGFSNAEPIPRPRPSALQSDDALPVRSCSPSVQTTPRSGC